MLMSLSARSWRALMLAVALMAAACAGPGASPSQDRGLALRTHEASTLCQSGGLLPFLLAGDPAAADPVWGVATDGSRLELSWPSGFRATSGPPILILAPGGTIVARVGDRITGAGGGTGADGRIWICDLGGQTYP